jgi:hypothetical protein
LLTRCSFQRNQQNSRFLRLPGEIRNKIYGYLFEDIFFTKTNSSFFAQRSIPERLHVLAVCRSVYKDTRLLLFAGAVVISNLFIFQDIRFNLSSVLPVQREALSTLFVLHRDLPAKDCKDSLPGLKRVVVSECCAAYCRTFRRVDDHQWRVRESLEAFREAVGKDMQVEHDLGPYEA